MTVEVRDGRTHQPVCGAAVLVQTVHFFVPTDLPLLGHHPIIDPTRPRSVQGATGSDGSVRLQVIVDHPVKVFVVARGYEAAAFDLDRHPAVTRKTSAWLDANPPDLAAPSRVQVRFLPSEAPR